MLRINHLTGFGGGEVVPPVTAADLLLAGETDGLAIEAKTGGSVFNTVKTSGTVSHPTVLINASASSKNVLWDDGTLHVFLSGNVAQEYDAALGYFGILIEPAATNRCLQSQTFGSGTWVKGNVTVTSNALLAPDNTTTADTCTTTASDSMTQTVTISSGVIVTFSIYLKAGTGAQWMRIRQGDGAGNTFSYWFDIVNGVTGSGLAAGAGWTAVASSIQTIGNGWFRCVATVDTTGTNHVMTLLTASADGSVVVDSTGTIYNAWGAQTEQNTMPSSYIATVGATATRAADVLSVDTDSFPWSDTNGTIYLDYKPKLVSAGTRFGWSAFLDANNFISYFGSAADPTMGNTQAGVADVAVDLGTLVANTRTQITTAYKANDFDGSQDGVAPTGDASATLTTGYDPLYVGTTGATGSELNGYIYRLIYVPYQRETVNGDIEVWHFA